MTGQIILGSLLIAATSLLHAVFLVGLIIFLKTAIPPIRRMRPFIGAASILMVAILGIVLSHTIHVWIWATIYLLTGSLSDLGDALYFSTVTFTTLGYGDIVLSERWQLLSSFEAVNGIILFGISTAFAFAVMRRIFIVIEFVKPE